MQDITFIAEAVALPIFLAVALVGARFRKLVQQKSQLAVRISEYEKSEATLVKDKESAKRHSEKQTQILQQSVARLEVVIDSLVEDGLIIISNKGVIEDFNLCAERLFGYSKQEVLRRNVDILMPQTTRDEHSKYVEKYLRTGEKNIIGIGREVLCRRKDGSVFQARLSVAESMVAGKKIFTGIIRDISFQKEIEEELKAAILKADQASNAKSEFLANMSHEFRTPLNGVMGMLELLKGTPLDARQDNYVTTAYGSANSLLQVISSILDYSKMQSHTLRIQNFVFDVRKVIEDSATLAATDVTEKGLEFNCVVAREIPHHLSGDAPHLQQIIINIVSNAVKFTEAGRIDLRISLLAMDNSKAQLRVEVQDSGIGIAETRLDSLFAPFTQKDGSSTRKYGGAGLGLTVAKRLIELMGGEIGVTSKEGQGTTFWFSLWFDLVELDEEKVTNFARDDLSVLVVDDNKTNLLVLEAMLRKFGLEPDLTNNGSEALKVLANKRYDLVLMDCQMPVIDGYTATREIRTLEKARGQDQHLPIVAVTAHALEGDREACLEAGMDDYMMKPILLSELESILKRWLPKSVEHQSQQLP